MKIPFLYKIILLSMYGVWYFWLIFPEIINSHIYWLPIFAVAIATGWLWVLLKVINDKIKEKQNEQVENH